ncbi:unnamed protein product [Ectocarpus fasciculatus]
MGRGQHTRQKHERPLDNMTRGPSAAKRMASQRFHRTALTVRRGRSSAIGTRTRAWSMFVVRVVVIQGASSSRHTITPAERTPSWIKTTVACLKQESVRPTNSSSGTFWKGFQLQNMDGEPAILRKRFAVVPQVEMWWELLVAEADSLRLYALAIAAAAEAFHKRDVEEGHRRAAMATVAAAAADGNDSATTSLVIDLRGRQEFCLHPKNVEYGRFQD